MNIDITTVLRSINHDVFVPSLDPASEGLYKNPESYSILDPNNIYRSKSEGTSRNIQEIQDICNVFVKEQPLTDIVAFRPSRILEHELVISLSSSVQVSNSIGELEEGLKKKFDHLKEQEKTKKLFSDFEERCEKYRYDTINLLEIITKQLNGKDLSEENIRDISSSGNQDMLSKIDMVIDILNTMELKNGASSEIKAKIVIDKLTNKFFRDEAKSLVSSIIQDQVNYDKEKLKEYFTGKIATPSLEEFYKTKSLLEKSLKENGQLFDYLEAEAKIKTKYKDQPDQVLTECKELLEKYLGKNNEYTNFLDCYVDRDKLVEEYFLPITERSLVERQTLTINGGIASGKGSSVQLVEHEYEYPDQLARSRNPADNVKINGDSYKALLNPSYSGENKKFSQLVQPEVSWIGNEIFNRIQQDTSNKQMGKDIVIDKVMLPSLWIEAAISGGGTLSGIIVSTAVDTAIPRAYARGKEIGRFEHTEGILKTHKDSVSWFQSIIKNEQFKGQNIEYYIYDNNVLRGSKPNLIASIDCKNNQIIVNDVVGLRKFLKKGLIDIEETLHDTHADTTKIEYGQDRDVSDVYKEFMNHFENAATVNLELEISAKVFAEKSCTDNLKAELDKIVDQKILEKLTELSSKVSDIEVIEGMKNYFDQLKTGEHWNDIKNTVLETTAIKNYIKSEVSSIVRENKEKITGVIGPDKSTFNEFKEKVSEYVFNQLLKTGDKVSEHYFSSIVQDIAMTKEMEFYSAKRGEIQEIFLKDDKGVNEWLETKKNEVEKEIQNKKDVLDKYKHNNKDQEGTSDYKNTIEAINGAIAKLEAERKVTENKEEYIREYNEKFSNDLEKLEQEDKNSGDRALEHLANEHQVEHHPKLLLLRSEFYTDDLINSFDMQVEEVFMVPTGATVEQTENY